MAYIGSWLHLDSGDGDEALGLVYLAFFSKHS